MAENIQVAVRVRPLSGSEQNRGCTQSIRRNGNEPQIIVNNANSFTFNNVYMPESTQDEVYGNTIVRLIDKLFEGFNCTVLAYGQTGSGKTYTMGTNYAGGMDDTSGIIPRAIIEIFDRLDQNVDLSATVTCSFMELYQEELYDLLAATKKALDIREINKNVEIPGLTEIRVDSPEETSNCLVQGSARRATGSTAMNETSSRSHAIFTIHLKIVKGNDSSAVTSKFHLVDLAGSERVNKTKATGERFKEGVKINQGLLCLGNVISALGTGQKTVSFRESKLTRLLQGSLGGNSVTFMIACVSPADYNLDETLSTLRYADRAKQIKNKPVVNRDPHSEEISRLNDIILRLRNQLAVLGRSGDARPESATLNGTAMLSSFIGNIAAHEDLKLANVKLVNEVAVLQLQMHTLDMMRDGCVEAVDKLNTQTKDLERMMEEEKPAEEIIVAMRELKVTLDALRMLLNVESEETVWHDAPSRESLENCEAGQTFMISNQTFTTDMKRLKDELTMKEHLAKKLMENLVPEEESHAMIATFVSKIAELEREKEELQVRPKAKPDVAAKLAEERRKKIALLEKEIDGMRKKITKHEKLIALHKNTQKSLNSLQTEITDLKQQKVQLVKNLRKDQDKYRQLKIKSDKEMNVMREKEKKRFHELKKLEDQHHRQKMYLQRRVEEANIKARRAENLLNKQRRTKTGTVLKDPAEIEKRLNQELEIIYSVGEVKASLTILMEARSELTNQLQALDRSKPEDAARAALLEGEIEERAHTINDLQQKIQSYDITAKVEAIAKEVQTDEALKILLEQVGDMRKEFYEEKLKWEVADNVAKVRIDDLQQAASEHGKELLRMRRDKDENMALLLDGYLEEDAAAMEDKMKPITLNLLEENKALRDQNEALKEELAAASRIMKPKKGKGSAAVGGLANKNVLRVKQEYIDTETEGELDDSYGEDDPDWSFSRERISAGRKRSAAASAKDTTVTLGGTISDTSASTAANNVSVSLCNCKTHCSRMTCGCRKKGLFCNGKCGCVSCVNVDRGSASEDTDGGQQKMVNGKESGDSEADEEEEEEEDGNKQEQKRIKLHDNEENVDLNNTEFKYPYRESKPVFYN